MLVINVAYFADDKNVEDVVLKSTMVRNETLKACYSISGYEELPREEKVKIYDSIRAKLLKKYGIDY